MAHPLTDTLASARPRNGIAGRLSGVLNTRDRQFWFLQVVGWLGYFIAAYLGALAHEKPTSYYTVLATAAIAGFALSVGLRYLYRPLWNKPPVVIIGGVLGLSYATALVWTMARNHVFWNIYKPEYEPDSALMYISGVTGGLYVFLCWSGLYFGIKYYQMLQQQKEQTLKAQALAHESQLKMLRYQLNPHFLFNTLNAISTLILDQDHTTANRAVTRLSDFLRYTLHNDPMQKVTLAQELRSTNLYLDIEKVRFQDRLHIDLDVDDEAMRALIPSLITQPIIENAVKYAIAPREEGGTLRISGHIVGGRLILELEDDGPGIDAEHPDGTRSCGVGLKNIRERLRQVYGDDFSFELTRARPQGLRVMIGVPYEPEEAS